MDGDVTFSKTKRTLTRSLKKCPVQRAVLSHFLSLQLTILSFFILNYCRTKLFGYLYIMPRTCVMFCENGWKTGNRSHRFPKESNIRRQWIRFVQTKRANFPPKKTGKEDPLDRLVICGDHFTAEDYEGINTSDHHSVNMSCWLTSSPDTALSQNQLLSLSEKNLEMYS